MKRVQKQSFFAWLATALKLTLLATVLGISYELADKAGLWFHHWISGLSVGLMFAYVAFRLSSPYLDADSPEMAKERHWRGAMTLAAFVCLFAYLACGYVAAFGISGISKTPLIDLSASESLVGKIALEFHFGLRWAFIGLFTLNLAFALKHAVIDQQRNTLRRAANTGEIKTARPQLYSLGSL